MNGYRIFLMIELARIAGIIPKTLEYDETYKRGIELLHEYINGDKFNDTYKPEYECFEAFLKDYRKRNAHKLIPSASPEKHFIYGVENHFPIEISATAHNLLIDADYIHFNGKEWLYFDNDCEYIQNLAKRHK